MLEGRIVPSTFTVKNLNASGPDSFRQAILDANAHSGADVIKFKAGLQGTINLTSELYATQSVTINGPGSDKIAVSGNHVTRVFRVTGSSTVADINDLTIENGLVSVPGGVALGGGLLNDGASVKLVNVVFAGNAAIGFGAGGGAVANEGGAHFTADHTVFHGNKALGSDLNVANGGAVYDDQNATVDITYSTFAGNQTQGGNANGGPSVITAAVR
jgi:hypothetical protein